MWLFILICWVVFIFTLSSQSYEKQSIKPTLHKWIEKDELARILPDTTFVYRGKTISSQEDPYNFVEFVFRKGAHLFMYAVMASILYMLLRSLLARRPFIAVFLTLLATVGVAGMDERNQLRSVNRTGNATDVLVDLTGACIGILFCLAVIGLFHLLRRRRR